MLTTDDLSFLTPSYASDNLNLIFGTGVRAIHHSGVSSKSELCIQNHLCFGIEQGWRYMKTIV